MSALAPLWFAVLAQGAPAQQPKITAESLIPAHTFVVVRAKSFDRLSEIALPFQRITDPQAAPFDFVELIASDTGLDVDLSSIDRAQPVIAAFSSSPTNQPVAMTVIARSKDVDALVADPKWKHTGWTCTPRGEFVVFATEPLSTALAPESTLLAGLDGGDFVLRVDYQEVLAQFGDEMDSELRAKFFEGSEGPDGKEPSAASTQFFEGMLDFINSIESFGLTLSSTNAGIHLGLELTGLPKSSIAEFPKVDTKPLEMLVKSLDPAAPILFAGALDTSKWVSTMEGLMELGAAETNEPIPDEARELLSHMNDVYTAMGPCYACDWRFGRDGISATYAMRPTDTTKLIESYLHVFEFPEMPFALEGPTAETVAGHEVMRYRMTVDENKLDTFDSEAEETGVPSMSAMFKRLFGTDAIPFGYTKHEGALLLGVGRESEMGPAIERLTAKTTPEVCKQLLSRLGAYNPGMVMRVDAPALAESVLGLTAAIEGKASPNADRVRAQFKDCPPMWMTFGLDQRTWRASIDADLARMIQAFSSLARSAPAAEASNIEDEKSPK